MVLDVRSTIGFPKAVAKAIGDVVEDSVRGTTIEDPNLVLSTKAVRMIYLCVGLDFMGLTAVKMISALRGAAVMLTVIVSTKVVTGDAVVMVLEVSIREGITVIVVGVVVRVSVRTTVETSTTAANEKDLAVRPLPITVPDLVD